MPGKTSEQLGLSEVSSQILWHKLPLKLYSYSDYIKSKKWDLFFFLISFNGDISMHIRKSSKHEGFPHQSQIPALVQDHVGIAALMHPLQEPSTQVYHASV